jgi:predicted Zn-dependent protease
LALLSLTSALKHATVSYGLGRRGGPGWGGWFAAGLAVAAACATNPATGKKDLVLVSEAQEIEMGDAADQQVRRDLGLYQDESLAAYVSGIGLRLAGSSERPHLPWKIQVVDSPVVNAFATPGGYVYLTRGILAYMDSEAAMVGILGHEIGHITARHSVQQISRAQLAGLGVGVGAMVVPEVRPFGDLLESGLGLLFLKFSRDDEREADSLGVRYSLAAGYDPTEMAAFFQVLDRLGDSSGEGIPTWLSTHPDPEDREQRILQLATAGQELAVREEEFKGHLEGLIYGENPREGFLDDNRFKHPELRFQVDFPAGWKVKNTRQAVYAASPDKDAAIQLTGSQVGAGTRPERHAASFFQQHGLESGTGERTRVGGFPAYRVPFRANSSAGVLIGEAGFVIDGETAYEILGYTPQQLYRRHRDTFLRVIGSFARLTDRASLEVQPRRIALYRVPRTMLVRAALAQSGAEEDLFSELALLNNLELDERADTGTLLKTVKGGKGSAKRRQP